MTVDELSVKLPHLKCDSDVQERGVKLDVGRMIWCGALDLASGRVKSSHGRD